MSVFVEAQTSGASEQRRSVQGFPEGQMNFDKRSFGLALLWLAALAVATVVLYAVVHH